MRYSHLGAFNFVLAIFLLLSSVAFGQTEKGSIIGTVVDEQGNAIPNATVIVTNLGTRTSQTFTTDNDGIYSVPFLIPGNYEVSVTASGFAKTVISNVVVFVGSRKRVDVVLKAGGVAETVVVTDKAPLLQTENANIGQVFDGRQLTEIPIPSNRNVYSFLTLDSTVNTGPTGNAEAFRLESGGSFSISGTRPSSITFKIDGQANNDPTFGTPTITPSLDSIKEFQLQNNAYSAEFEGITQVNIATKSGTNQFRGSLFEFVRNDLFEPRNPNAPPDSSGKPGKNKLRFNQFGGTIGGPLWLPRLGEGGPMFIKDRTFFFFSYEGLRDNARTLGFTRVLTQAERSGDFSAYLGGCITVGGNPVPLLRPDGTPSGECIRQGQIFDPATTVANPRYNPGQPESAFNPQFIRQPFPNNVIPANRIDPRAIALINVQQPLPNFTSTSDLNYAGPQGNNFVNNQFSVRIDHRFSDNDNAYGRFTWQKNKRDSKAVLPFQQKSIRGDGMVFNSVWTHIFGPSLVNELRLGYVRGVYGDTVEEIDPTRFGISNTQLKTLPGILLTADALNYGGFTGSILQTIQNTYQIADNLSWSRDRHSFKFGFKADHNRFKNSDLINTNGRLFFNGQFSVGNSSLIPNASRPNSIADFLLGNISSESLNLTNPAYLRNTPMGFYALDDWRVTRRLTINLGLRYEYHQPFLEENRGGRTVDLTGNGRLLVADPAVAQAANSPLVVCCTGRRVVEADKNDFAPRIGVAFQPFKNDNAVIRAGYGIFYADTSQFFHWLYYRPLRGSGIFTPALANFTTPSATLNDPFPSSQFSPPAGSGLFIGIPAGVNPAALNNQPVVSAFGIGDYSTPESHQWSVGIQREFWKGLLVDVSYKGNVSKNLPVQWFFNQPTFSPTPVNFQSLDPAANPYLRRPFAAFTIGSNIVANVLKSNYHAGTLKLEKRLSPGYSFLSTYTWSKAIDQGAEVFTVVSNHAFLPNNHDFNANRGPSIFDVRHRWVTSGIYELPFGKGKPFLNRGGIVNALLGGWRLAGIFTLQTGLPFQPLALNLRTNTGMSVLERGDLAVENPYWTKQEWKAQLEAWKRGSRLYFIRPDAININYAPGTGGNLGRNVFRTPFGRRLDLSLAKKTRFTETVGFEVRVDVFDVTREIVHRPNIANAVSTALTSPLRGSIAGRNLFFVPHIIQLGARITF